MIEPSIGDRVRFKEGGSQRVGTVVDVITAGREQGRGLYTFRRRARIRFDVDGWETHRDLDAIQITECDEQLPLFCSEELV